MFDLNKHNVEHFAYGLRVLDKMIGLSYEQTLEHLRIHSIKDRIKIIENLGYWCSHSEGQGSSYYYSKWIYPKQLLLPC